MGVKGDSHSQTQANRDEIMFVEEVPQVEVKLSFVQ